MKYLLWIALFLLVYWTLRKTRNRGEKSPPTTSRAPEQMVTCAHCGINLPVSESIHDESGRHFCCIDHQRAAELRKS